MPNPKETLLYVLGSEEFYNFYQKYIVGQKEGEAKKEEEKSGDLLESYLQKIQSPECFIAILGVQGSGKTSLLNALLFQEELLPVEVEETTCIPTLIRRVYPKEEPGAEVHYQDGHTESLILKRESLDKIVDNRYNPGNILKAAFVICRVNSPLLQEGFVFVDLPGVGSLTETNEQATLTFLRQTHIGIFMLRTVPPITDSEAGFIRIAWPMVQHSIFVQNLWAKETEKELKEGMAHNEKVLQAIAKEKQTALPKEIIAINISEACRASFAKDAQAMAQSGLEHLKKKIREFADRSFLQLFFQQTAKFFIRLIERARDRIQRRLQLLQQDREEVLKKFSQQREKYLQNKGELEERVARHLEDFLEKASYLKTEWVPKKLEEAMEKILEKLDKSPLEDFKEADFRQLVRQTCSDYFGLVYHDLQRELARLSEDYVASLSKTLQEMASMEDLFQEENYYKAKSKDPKAATGWSVILTGSIAPIALAGGPIGWGIFGGALLAGGLVRWISSATAHKRILRGLRKSIGDARMQIMKEICHEIDGFGQKIAEAIRTTVQTEIQSYEKELQRIDQDLKEQISSKDIKKAELEADMKQVEIFLNTLTFVK